MTDTDQSVAVREDSAIAVAPAQSMMNFIASALENPNIDAAKLKALLDMQREVMADQAKVEFNRALHAAQAEMPQVEKDGTVSLITKEGKDLGSYRFATWENMDRVLRPIMAKHGFTLSFDMAPRQGDGGGATVTAKLSHVAGHSENKSISLALDTGAGRNNLQAMGSSIQYAKRYLAEMHFNIVRKAIDDDGKLGGMQFVTPSQAAEIEVWLGEGGIDRDKFLATLGHTHVGNILAGEFNMVRNILAQRIAARKQKAAAT